MATASLMPALLRPFHVPGDLTNTSTEEQLMGDAELLEYVSLLL